MKAVITGNLSTAAMEAMPHNDVSRGLKMAVDETGLQFLFSTMAGYGDMQAKGDQMSRYDG